MGTGRVSLNAVSRELGFSELTSLGCGGKDAELGNRAGNEPSPEMLFDFAILTFVI